MLPPPPYPNPRARPAAPDTSFQREASFHRGRPSSHQSLHQCHLQMPPPDATANASRAYAQASCYSAPTARSKGARPPRVPVLQGCPSSKGAHCPRVPITSLMACALCKGVLLCMVQYHVSSYPREHSHTSRAPWAHNPEGTATRCVPCSPRYSDQRGAALE